MVTEQKQKAKRRPSPEQALFKALSHDLRSEILTELNDHGMSSPAEIARRIGADVRDVTSHMKQLENYGCAEFVEEKKTGGRGSYEHFYRATKRTLLSDEQWEQMSPAARDGFSRHIIRCILNDLEQGFDAGTVDGRTDRHMTRVPLPLDEEGWGNVMEILERALEEILDEQAKSYGRRAKSGEEPIQATVALFGFEMPSSRKPDR